MKISKFLALTVLVVSAGTFLTAQAQEHPTKTEHPPKTEHPAKAEHPSKGDDIFAVVSGSGQFKTLVAAIKEAGLVEKFRSEGPFTVFAPTDKAFAKLPAGTLEDLLKPANKAKLAGLLAGYVVPGKIMAADLKTMKTANVNGQDLKIKVTDGGVTVDGAKLIKADMMASNGIIHAIDTVIFPTFSGKMPASDKPKDHPAH